MERYIASVFFYPLVLGVLLTEVIRAEDLVFYRNHGELYYVNFDHPRYESILSTVPNSKFLSVYGTEQGLYVVYSSKHDSPTNNEAVIVKYLEPPTLTAENNQPVLIKELGQGDKVYHSAYSYKCLLLVMLSFSTNEMITYEVLRGSRVLDTVVLSRTNLDEAALRDVPSTRSDSILLDRIISSDLSGIDGVNTSNAPCSPFEVTQLACYNMGIYIDGVLQNTMEVNYTSDVVLNTDDTIISHLSDISNVSNGKFVLRAEVFVVNSRYERLNREYYYLLLCDVSGIILKKVLMPRQGPNVDGLAFLSW